MADSELGEGAHEVPASPIKKDEPYLIVYGHNKIFYWWPVWVVGLILAGITFFGGKDVSYERVLEPEEIAKAQVGESSGEDDAGSDAPAAASDGEGESGNEQEAGEGSESSEESAEDEMMSDEEKRKTVAVQLRMHESRTLGLIWILVFLVVLIFTNFHLKGIASAVFVMAIIIGALALQLMGITDEFFRAVGLLAVHMNLGFYLFTSLALLVIWALSFWVFDRITYWRITPGQLTECHLIGEGQTTYDARGMVVEKQREDIFRNWILGFGTGNLEMNVTGARKAKITITDALQVDKKANKIQRLVSIEPAD